MELDGRVLVKDLLEINHQEKLYIKCIFTKMLYCFLHFTQLNLENKQYM